MVKEPQVRKQKVVETLRPIKLVYPEIAKRNGREGKIKIHIHVNAEGTGKSVDFLDADRPKMFDRAVREMYLQEKLFPASENGYIVETTVIFTLKEGG